MYSDNSGILIVLCVASGSLRPAGPRATVKQWIHYLIVIINNAVILYNSLIFVSFIIIFSCYIDTYYARWRKKALNTEWLKFDMNHVSYDKIVSILDVSQRLWEAEVSNERAWLRGGISLASGTYFARTIVCRFNGFVHLIDLPSLFDDAVTSPPVLSIVIVMN